jgi:hypothetical protein
MADGQRIRERASLLAKKPFIKALRGYAGNCRS